jgi:hypothetical protein
MEDPGGKLFNKLFCDNSVNEPSGNVNKRVLLTEKITKSRKIYLKINSLISDCFESYLVSGRAQIDMEELYEDFL